MVPAMDPAGKPLHTLTAAELRAWAETFRTMAEAAIVPDETLGLRKLAERYEALATAKDSQAPTP
jgi:hypothetical protein